MVTPYSTLMIATEYGNDSNTVCARQEHPRIDRDTQQFLGSKPCYATKTFRSATLVCSTAVHRLTRVSMRQ